jgi:TRADD-N domain-containing protein
MATMVDDGLSPLKGGVAHQRGRADSLEVKLRACEDLSKAMDGPEIGEIVAKTERLVLHYYKDVQSQAITSFLSAQRVAKIGFAVLVISLLYIASIDVLAHLKNVAWFQVPDKPMDIGWVGVASGLVVEFIAAVNFWQYRHATNQFGAFHICLERTHRYLLAYKMAEKLGTAKDETLERLVCIMANAPMITRQDIEGVATGKLVPSVRSTVDDTMLKGMATV